MSIVFLASLIAKFIDQYNEIHPPSEAPNDIPRRFHGASQRDRVIRLPSAQRDIMLNALNTEFPEYTIIYSCTQCIIKTFSLLLCLQVLCELQMALAERGVGPRADVTREVMSREYRDMSVSATYRNLRDWLIFRDYMNGLEYIIEVFEQFVQGIRS